MKRLLFCFMCVLLLFVAGCSSNKDIYVADKIIIDVNGDAILRNLDKDTLEEYPIISQDIELIGDKIIIKDNEVIFSGKETKGIIASITENDENIDFAELPTFIIKGAKFVNGEVRIYIYQWIKCYPI